MPLESRRGVSSRSSPPTSVGRDRPRAPGRLPREHRSLTSRRSGCGASSGADEAATRWQGHPGLCLFAGRTSPWTRRSRSSTCCRAATADLSGARAPEARSSRCFHYVAQPGGRSHPGERRPWAVHRSVPRPVAQGHLPSGSCTPRRGHVPSPFASDPRRCIAEPAAFSGRRTPDLAGCRPSDAWSSSAFRRRVLSIDTGRDLYIRAHRKVSGTGDRHGEPERLSHGAPGAAARVSSAFARGSGQGPAGDRESADRWATQRQVRRSRCKRSRADGNGRLNLVIIEIARDVHTPASSRTPAPPRAASGAASWRCSVRSSGSRA